MPLHDRRTVRLRGYDYTQSGSYFVTICTYDRFQLFSEIVNGEMQLNGFGEVAREEWFKSAQIRPSLRLNIDEHVVMPNHIHGIIHIVHDDGVGACAPCPYAISVPVPWSVSASPCRDRS
jgi:REP-associated tyrosine transposase